MEKAVCNRELVQLPRRLTGNRVVRSPCGVPRPRCVVARALPRPPERKQELEDGRERYDGRSPDFSLWQRALAVVSSGCCAFSAIVGSAAAAFDSGTNVLGPSTDALLGSGPEFSFTSLLLYTLLGYWLLKALLYLTQNSPDGPEHDETRDQDQGQQKKGRTVFDNEAGHAHIRSYVDSSQPVPGSELDARDLRNASLARSAAYRVMSTIRESQPRIHSLVEELAGPKSKWPLLPPHNLDVDFVAALVYDKVLQERAAKVPDHELSPRERAALETVLLEEVAEKTAAEQVAQFVIMAAQGKLHPNQPGNGGAGHPPPSHAH